MSGDVRHHYSSASMSINSSRHQQQSWNQSQQQQQQQQHYSTEFEHEEVDDEGEEEDDHHRTQLHQPLYPASEWDQKLGLTLVYFSSGNSLRILTVFSQVVEIVFAFHPVHVLASFAFSLRSYNFLISLNAVINFSPIPFKFIVAKREEKGGDFAFFFSLLFKIEFLFDFSLVQSNR